MTEKPHQVTKSPQKKTKDGRSVVGDGMYAGPSPKNATVEKSTKVRPTRKQQV